MPQRQNLRRVDASGVQGEGAYVVLRALPWALQQRAQRALVEQAGGTLPSDLTQIPVSLGFLDANDALTYEMLAGCVAEWNWVDDAGAPLPLPKDGGLERLTGDEVMFLLQQLRLQPAARKN
jgi:hypothetical protein